MTTAPTPDPNGTTQILTPENSDIPNAAGHLPLFQPIANDLARIGVIVNNIIAIPYHIADGSYASKSMSVNSEDTQPRGVAISADGTKMYMLGATSDTIYQYTLSTPGDVDSGSYASKSMSVNSEDTQPLDIAISADGTKMYMLGATSDTIYQYTLSTPGDVDSGSYASKSMSVNSEDNTPQGFDVSADGTKIYMVGVINKTIYQYTLSTPGDVGTGSYASKSMSVNSEDTNPKGVSISADGTKIYMMGATSETIYQYTLSTPGDVGTGSYASKSMIVTGEDVTPQRIVFSADGTKMYMVGDALNAVYQYYTTRLVIG